jgi:hypothetical protein
MDPKGGRCPEIFQPQRARMAAVITLNIKAGKLHYET